MKRQFVGALLALLVPLAAGAFAQPNPGFEDKILAPGIHELVLRDETGFLVKVVASVGDDGLLLVDSGYAENGPALVEAINKLGKGLPRIIINTHSHGEHLAGQASFGRGPVIISHKNLRDRYVNGLYVFNKLPPEALPQVTFTDTMSVNFKGEEIRLIAFPGAHDDSDIIVWFTKSKVVCTEALINCAHFPSIDGETGDVLRYPEVAARIIAILPEDVILVPGHSEDCDVPGARAFQAMLTSTIDIVKAELAKGKTLGQMRSEDVLAAYKSFESYVGRNDWLQYLTEALSAPTPKVPRGDKPWPYGVLYRAYAEKGADGLLQAYGEMRTAKPGEYFFSEDILLYAGRRLAYTDRRDYPGAIRVLERWLKENPQGRKLALCHSTLGAIQERLGDKAKALECYKLALLASPDDEALQAKVKEIGVGPKQPD